MQELNYEKDIKIDHNNLDLEWLRQPDLAFAYGNALADARAETDLADENLDISKAKAVQKAFGLGLKVDAAKAEADLDPDYLEALESYRTAKHKQGLIQAAYDAVQTKKSALENLVRLHGQQYFASPQEPKELGEKLTMKQQAMNRQRNDARSNAQAAAAQRRERSR